MNTSQDQRPNASILPFPRRRGRPRTMRPRSDTGTPELVMKRLKGETAEALDLCLERGIITAEQHWCGIHLRWLYTLRYGAPGLRAIDPTHLGGMEIKTDDPAWRTAREEEFHEAIKKIIPSGHAPLVINVCIYNERPGFLNSRAIHAAKTLESLRDGLDILAAHWSR